MATQYTSLLGLALPVTGELSGTWGDTVNTAITSLLDSAVAGTTTLSADTDVTLTTTTGVANQARQAIILWTANGSVTRNVTAPAQSKIYTVINASAGTQSIVIRGAGPTTGVTIIKGESAQVAWNGSDFIKISNTGGSASFTNVTVSGTTTLSGLTASTALALNGSKEVVSVTNTGTGNNVLSASPTLTGTVAGASLQLSSLTSGRVTYAGASGLLQDSANFTFNGTRLTVADLADSGLTATRVVYSTTGGALVDSANLTFDGTNLTLGGGTANGVAYLNGSKVLTTGSALVFDGSNLGVGVTPSAWVNTAKAVQVGSHSSFYDQTGATVVGNNFFNNSSGQSTRLNTGRAGALVLENGAFAFQTATVEIIGTAISFTQAMTLNASGNLGIGNTSPTARLDVTGTAAISGAVTLSGGTANGVAYLNGSKVLTTGSALTFDGTKLTVGTATAAGALTVVAPASTSYGAFDAPTAGYSFHDYKYNGTRYGLIGQGSALYVSGSNTDFGVLASNALVFGASGSEQMRLTSTGLGIGTSSPTRKLDVLGNAKFGTGPNPNSATLMVNNVANTATGIQLFQEGIESWIMGMPANSAALTWSASGAEQMRLTSTGLGIGTSSPALPLDVVSNSGANAISIRGRAADDIGTLGFYTNAGSNIAQIQLRSDEMRLLASGARSQTFYTNGSERMRLSSDGNLGLGVTPSAWGSGKAFEIAASGNSLWAGTGFINLTQNVAFTSGAYRYGISATAGRFEIQGNEHRWFTAPSGTAGDAISFTQAMTLDASGNLGIGTSSPENQLQVGVRFGVSSGGVTRWGQVITASGRSNSGYLTWDTGLVAIGAEGATAMRFDTNGLERMRLDSSGNLGLGVTPSAWGSIFRVQQFGNYGAFVAGRSDAQNQIQMGVNAFFNGTNFVYSNSDVASRYYQISGQHRWDVAPSGTAGNAISFTQAMTLTAGGDLGVGTTSPSSIGGSITTVDVSGAAGGGVRFQRTSATATSGYIVALSGEFRVATADTNPLTFFTNNTERARIDSSGNLLVGTTSSVLGNNNGMYFAPSSSGGGQFGINHANGIASGSYYVAFAFNGSEIGSIKQNGTTQVSYNTSSDYRLKENIQPMTGALAKVALLKPCTYNWKADGSDGEGFIAHELAEVCPQAVTGEKDAVDAEGNPVYQGIDTSFLVATLTAALQEAVAEINSLKARLDAANI